MWTSNKNTRDQGVKSGQLDMVVCSCEKCAKKKKKDGQCNFIYWTFSQHRVFDVFQEKKEENTEKKANGELRAFLLRIEYQTV